MQHDPRPGLPRLSIRRKAQHERTRTEWAVLEQGTSSGALCRVELASKPNHATSTGWARGGAAAAAVRAACRTAPLCLDVVAALSSRCPVEATRKSDGRRKHAGRGGQRLSLDAAVGELARRGCIGDVSLRDSSLRSQNPLADSRLLQRGQRGGRLARDRNPAARVCHRQGSSDGLPSKVHAQRSLFWSARQREVGRTAG